MPAPLVAHAVARALGAVHRDQDEEEQREREQVQEQQAKLQPRAMEGVGQLVSGRVGGWAAG